MLERFLTPLALATLWLHAVMFTPANAQPMTEFYVIVNAANDEHAVDKTTSQLIRRLYLKQKTSWPSGYKATVFSRPNDSVEEQIFRRRILGMSNGELSDYWLQMKQVRGETRPRSIGSTRILLRQVNRKVGSLSVISKKDYDNYAHTFDQVRVLYSFQGAGDD